MEHVFHLRSFGVAASDYLCLFRASLHLEAPLTRAGPGALVQVRLLRDACFESRFGSRQDLPRREHSVPQSIVLARQRLIV